MNYLKLFENHTAYSAAESGLLRPNVSLCEQENEVHYNPIVDPRLIIRYNVTDANELTQMFNYSALMGGTTSMMFDNIEVDGADVSLADLDAEEGYYQLSVGRHTVKYTLKDPTSIANFAFGWCYSLTSVNIPESVDSIGHGAFCSCPLDSASETAVNAINPYAMSCDR